MNKKRRPWLVNAGITAVVIITSFLLMGAYDSSCDNIEIAELNYDFNDFSGFDTSIGNASQTIVNIEQGTAVSIPVEVDLTMMNDYTLDAAYDWSSAALSTGPGFSVPGISFGVTNKTITSGTATTTGATITFTADLELTGAVDAGDYNIPITFSIYNTIYNQEYSLADSIYLNVYDFEIAASSLPDGTVGQNYSETLSLRGGTSPYTWSATGLPAELSINSSTGVISGIPAADDTLTVTISVTDSSATPKTATATLDLSIYNAPLSITTNSLPDGRVGTSYSKTLEASGGESPYTWDATGLPAGMTIDSSTGLISGIPTGAGISTVSITVTDNGSDTSNANLNLMIAERISGNSSNRSQQDKPTVKGSIIETKTNEPDQNSGIAKIQTITNTTLDKAFNNTNYDGEGRKTVSILVPEKEGAKGYETVFPSGLWTSGDGNRAVTVKTAIAEVTVPNNMLGRTEIPDNRNISLTVASGDKAKLDEATRAQIGDRPLIEITLSVDGKQTSWRNDSAPVTISIPYTPTAEELKDPEHISVWYIDGAGKAVPVTSGRYDAATGRVIFKATHFSEYAVTFVQKTFDDLGRYAWAKKSIEVLAAKGIVTGSTETQFNPSGKITRADFLVLLTRTLGLNARTDINFSDVEPGKYYYEAVGTAKELGIVTGLDHNTFKPKEMISRQDMMVMAQRALNMVNPETKISVTDNLEQYADKDMISGYARESVSGVIKSGLITGSNGKINPLSNTTRAEAAVFLYNIYHGMK
ncbi:MAG: S-layer homology domain-containing protein [Eubacteriales bacterium]|nr:S-layer homology domain-containing protein [Eubacteriales bacterium]